MQLKCIVEQTNRAQRREKHSIDRLTQTFVKYCFDNDDFPIIIADLHTHTLIEIDMHEFERGHLT
jgi:hypothetical protein